MYNKPKNKTIGVTTSIDDTPQYLFHQGTNFRAYEYYGAHIENEKTVFRVWAPNAASVSVVGDFNGWDASKNVMSRGADGETFCLAVPSLKKYDNYKYAIKSSDGSYTLKADPYALHSELPDGSASKLYISSYAFTDEKYENQRSSKSPYASPINIYEVHLGSFMRKSDGNYYSYREIAEKLVSYVIKMGYTHIEFMPLADYPFDGSWGYQVTGYFAITSRFGTPDDFKYLVDYCHNNGVGVIMDWVPAHFPKDAYGLAKFDGTYLYENPMENRREHKGWGTLIFDFGRAEVRSFLISSADFLFREYHIDGLRIDAVSSMLYLDYDRRSGEWTPNRYGDNRNLDAVEFLQKLNTHIFERYPYALMIAEESTPWPMVTKPVSDGGLGFNFKWDMGWMNDTLSYFSTDTLFRGDNYNKLTFSMMYAFSENYILPISHDEVVHGKHSLVDKMPGSYEDKFASCRTFFAYMIAHTGKKLMFMGGEFGQFKEWNYKEGLEFFLTEYEKHSKLQNMVADLNALYLSTPALYEIDNSWDGFKWISVNENNTNILSFWRIDKNKHKIIALFNLSGLNLDNYRLGVEKGAYSVFFNSDDAKYGGAGYNGKKRVYHSTRVKAHGEANSIKINLPRLSAIYLEKNEKG